MGKEIFTETRTGEELMYQPCTYCGNYDRTTQDGQQMVGIDRIDNSLGYTKENCQSCCKVCNIMCGRLTVEQFLKKYREYIQT